MKVQYALISFLFLSTLITSCKKENNPLTSPPSSSSTLPVVFTSNINFVDEGTSVSMNGVPNYSSNPNQTLETAGDITNDSILRLYFEDEATHTDFSLLIMGTLIQPGNYSFTATSANSLLAMYLENTQSGKLYSFTSDMLNSAYQYNGQPIVSNGSLTITSVSQTSISGTLNAELYYATSGFYNQTHKVTINNGTFSCDVLRY